MRSARRAQVRDEFEQFVAGSADQLLGTAYLVVWDPGEDLVGHLDAAAHIRRRRSRRSRDAVSL
jgi:hypothetical protein